VKDMRETIELQLRDLGDGTVHLKLQQPVPSALAEQIMALLQRSPVGEHPSLAARLSDLSTSHKPLPPSRSCTLTSSARLNASR
jgi:hypothetical protein